MSDDGGDFLPCITNGKVEQSEPCPPAERTLKHVPVCPCLEPVQASASCPSTLITLKRRHRKKGEHASLGGSFK